MYALATWLVQRIKLATMGMFDTFGFSSKEYTLHLKANYKETARLHAKHRQKVVLIGMFTMSKLLHAYLAVPSGGSTLLTMCYAARQQRVAEQQMACIEDLLRQKGWAVPEMRKKDRRAGAILAVFSSGLFLIIPGRRVGSGACGRGGDVGGTLDGASSGTHGGGSGELCAAVRRWLGVRDADGQCQVSLLGQ